MKPILQGEINLELRDALRTYLRGSRGGMTSQSNVKQSFIRTKLTNKSLVPTFLIVYAAQRDSAGSIAHNVGVDGADWQLCRFMHMKNVVYRHGTLSRTIVKYLIDQILWFIYVSTLKEGLHNRVERLYIRHTLRYFFNNSDRYRGYSFQSTWLSFFAIADLL